jgi:hypothetical protein
MSYAGSQNKNLQRVRIFFRKIKWKKVLAFSFFVFIASILWFMQIYDQYFETSFYIPIKYESVPDSIVFNNSLPDKIKVKVRDYGRSIFHHYLEKQDTLRIDVSEILDNELANKSIQGGILESYINHAIPQTAQLRGYEPALITFSYSALQSQKIPVIFDGQVNLSPGYFLNGDIRISPETIMAYGTRADLAKLTYAYTTGDTLNGLESNRKISFDLVDKKNIKYSPHSVDVYIPVEAFQQKKIEVPVKCLNLPDNMIVKFFPSGVSLSFFVGVSISDSVNLNDFSVGVDYNGIKNSKSISVPVRVTESPPYAKNLTLDPPEVEYIFEYKNADK